MPLPTRLPPPAAGTPRRRRPGPIGALVLTAFCLAALTAVTGYAVGFGLLVAATAALAAAGVLALREHWAAAAPTAPPRAVSPAAPESLPGDGDTLTRQLRRLHAAHVEKVNGALDEGREALARELADDYTDRALELLTRAG